MKYRSIQIGFTRFTSNDSEFTYKPIHKEPTKLYVSPKHHFAQRKQIPLEEIFDEPLITYPKDTKSRSIIDLVLNQLNLNYKVKYESNNLNLIKFFTAKGDGVHLSGPLYMKDKTATGELIEIEIEDNPFPDNQIFIVFRESELGGLEEIFIEHFEMRI